MRHRFDRTGVRACVCVCVWERQRENDYLDPDGREGDLWNLGFQSNIDTPDNQTRFQHVYSPWKFK
jgi:hypothetical protein